MFADYILTEDKEKDSIESLIKSGCVSFNTKEKAEAFFEKYNEQQRNATIRWNKIIAEGTDDGSKDVTIHEFSE